MQKLQTKMGFPVITIFQATNRNTQKGLHSHLMQVFRHVLHTLQKSIKLMSAYINPSFYFNTSKESGHVAKDMPLYKTLGEAKGKRIPAESVYYAFFDTSIDKYRTFQIVKPYSV